MRFPWIVYCIKHLSVLLLFSLFFQSNDRYDPFLIKPVINFTLPPKYSSPVFYLNHKRKTTYKSPELAQNIYEVASIPAQKSRVGQEGECPCPYPTLFLDEDILSEDLIKKIELKWQKIWELNNTFITDVNDDTKPHFYCLAMFPYPSGNGLHVGHCKGYTASDILARWKRMQGYNVLYPVGWDSFGLPTEQSAIKEKQHPRVISDKNIQSFTKQLKRLGFSYDWKRQINTSSPEYFSWTQWIFLRLFENNLAYFTLRSVKWCPKLGTVLSNEEIVDGKSERGGHPVENRLMKQWVLRITDYADRLIDDLETLTKWPMHIKEMQSNWIGRKQGYTIKTRILDSTNSSVATQDISVFSDSLKNLHKVNSIILPLSSKYLHVQDLPSMFKSLNMENIFSYFTDLWEKFNKTLIHNIYDGTDSELMIYKTGFIAEHPTLENVSIPILIGLDTSEEYTSNAYFLTLESLNGEHFGTNSITQVRQKVISSSYGELTYLLPTFIEHGINRTNITGKLSKGSVYKLKDWLFSRQRLWGEPFPIAYDIRNPLVPIPLPEKMLPITLPDFDTLDEKQIHSVTRSAPLTNYHVWKSRTLNNQEIVLETNVMPQWAGSCWYYLRFLNPHDTSQIISKELAKNWLPINIYIGGAEHAILHLLYSRFWHKFLYDINIVFSKEPFEALVTPGPILGSNLTHFAFYTADGKFTNPEEVKFQFHRNLLRKILLNSIQNPSSLDSKILGYHKTTLSPVYSQLLNRTAFSDQISYADGIWKYCPKEQMGPYDTLTLTEKMSKSKGNIVSPDDIIEKYGADTLRLHLMFLAPLTSSSPWNEQGLKGISRFLRRIYGCLQHYNKHKDTRITTSHHQCNISSSAPSLLQPKLISNNTQYFITTPNIKSGKLYNKSTTLINHSPSSKQMRILDYYISIISINIEQYQFNLAIANLMKLFNTMRKWDTGIPIQIYKTFIIMLHPFAPHLTEEIFSQLISKNSDRQTSLAYYPWPVPSKNDLSDKKHRK